MSSKLDTGNDFEGSLWAPLAINLTNSFLIITLGPSLFFFTCSMYDARDNMNCTCELDIAS